jgi:hypothetical protein
MIDSSAAQYEALALATEDANGLYDLLFAFDTAFPEDLIEERLRAAKQALRDLISQGCLRIWYASWTSPDRESPIENGSVDSVIDNPYWWENHIDRMVWFAATDAGRAAFAELNHTA